MKKMNYKVLPPCLDNVIVLSLFISQIKKRIVKREKRAHKENYQKKGKL